MTFIKPLVSIVIPTYNRGYMIENSINSVLSQTYRNFELLIIDDASTDDTEYIVKNIKDSRIRYIKLEKNSRGTKTRNTGINLSKGDYIAFLDSDDRWFPEKLEKQLKFILNSNIPMSNFMCFSDLIVKNESYHKKRVNRPINESEDIMDYIFVGRNIVQTSTYIVAAKVAKRTLFNSNLKKHQDWDFCLRLRNNNTNFIHFPGCFTIWEADNREDRISNNNDNDLSLSWLEHNKNQLSIRAQWAFKSIVIVPNLVRMKKYGEAIKTLLFALFYRGINFRSFLKELAKIVLPLKIQVVIKNTFLYKSNKFNISN